MFLYLGRSGIRPFSKENPIFRLWTRFETDSFPILRSIILKIEGLKEVIEKNRLDTNFEQLVLDLKQELGSYV